MKTKLRKEYDYEGLGFPIRLCNVEMVKIQNEWHPKIDIRKVADLAIKKLVVQKDRFTGNQVRFIRKYFSMSLRDFAETVVRESHTAVAKWEKSGNEITSMDINIEKIIRLYIYQKIMKPKKIKFYDDLLELDYISSRRHPARLHLQIKRGVVAAVR